MQRMEGPEENQGKRLAFELIATTGLNVFLTGKAGTGKTTFLNALKKTKIKKMVVLAPTGVAAINAGGNTLHSFFQLPFGMYVPGYVYQGNNYKLRKEKIRLIRSLELLVIDEVSMLRADLLDQISDVLKKYRLNTAPFGGVQLLLIGDVQQLAPVVSETEWHTLSSYYASPYFFESRALREAGFVSVELKKIYRQKDRDFIEILNRIRNKNISAELLGKLNARHQVFLSGKKLDEYIFLTTHNAIAQRENEDKLAALPAPAKIFKAKISGNYPAMLYPVAERLELKEGARVMFVKNDSSPEKRYYNGKIGVVKSIQGQDMVEVESEGKIIEVSPEKWENVKFVLDAKTKEIEEKVEGEFSQIPLKLAWAITIHKSQGLTFDKVLIDASKSFAPGQVYVALSRCRTLDGVLLKSPIQPDALKKDMTIDAFCNYVSGEKLDEEKLADYQWQYLKKLIEEQFCFDDLWFSLQELYSLGERYLRKSYSKLYSDLENIILTFREKVRSVSEIFLQELQRVLYIYRQDRNRIPLMERSYKAAVYFSRQLEELLLGLLPRFKVEVESEAAKAQIKEAAEILKQRYFLKMETLNACIEGEGFDQMTYLKVKSAVLNSEGGKSKLPSEKKVRKRKIRDL